MSDYYRPQRTRNMFNPASKDPFEVSRSAIDLFMRCPRCFYIDRRLGTSVPPGFPFALNSAVDQLLKKEFDLYRRQQKPHPLMTQFRLDAVPYQHNDLDIWRDSLRRGIRFLHQKTNLIIKGGIDDVWINANGELHIVDYKATSKNDDVNLEAKWQGEYKRQVEVYQWLFRNNGFKVSDTAFFIYCNGITTRDIFNARLEFDIKIIPYIGRDGWVEKTIRSIHSCLNLDQLPASGPECDFCAYFDQRSKHELKAATSKKRAIRKVR